MISVLLLSVSVQVFCFLHIQYGFVRYVSLKKKKKYVSIVFGKAEDGNQPTLARVS